MLSVRPKIAELVFYVYGKPLHPELFDVHGRQVVERSDYRATIEITSAGHVATFHRGGQIFTEVCASAHQVLPETRRLISYKLVGKREDKFTCLYGLSYRTRFELEQVKPGMFWSLQEELAKDGLQGGLFHKFDSSGRVAMGAVSFVHAEARDRLYTLRTMHTFPDDYAIVRTHTVIELPGK